MQTYSASRFVCLSAAFAPYIKHIVTSESVIHFPSENRPSVHVGYIPAGTSHKQKWYKCMSHLVNRVELSGVQVWVYLCCVLVSQDLIQLFTSRADLW
jgi:hypothetical protein